MVNKQRDRKLNILTKVSIAFAMFFLFIFGFTITLAYFGSNASDDLDDNIILANLDIDVTYTLNFEDVILPNTTYTGSDYFVDIKNSGNSGPIYLRVKVENEHAENMNYILASENLWAKGGADNNEYYYLSTLDTNSTQTFFAGIKTLNNFTNEIAGETIDIKFTVYAIQSQYDAVRQDNSWIEYAPQEFKTFIGL